MALDAVSTTFALTLSAPPATQVVSVPGVTPKVVLFAWTQATSLDTQLNTVRYGMGLMQSATKRGAITGWIQDNASPANQGSVTVDDACISYWANASQVGAMDFSAFGSGSFTIIVDDAVPQAYQVHALALGGAELEANVFFFKASTGTGNESFAHGLSAAPEVCLFFASLTPTLGVHRDHQTTTTGWATRDGTQAVTATHGRDDPGPVTLAGNITKDTRCVVGLDGWTGNIEHELRYVSADATTITLERVINNSQPQVLCLAMRGLSARAGTTQARTDTNTISIPSPGFTSRVMLAMSTGNPVASETVKSAPARHSFGWATGAGGVSVAFFDQDGIDPSDAACWTSATRLVQKWNRTGTDTWVDGGSLDVDSLAGAPVLDMLIADSQTTLIPYLILGDVAPVGIHSKLIGKLGGKLAGKV
jgi:hypothetical protein